MKTCNSSFSNLVIALPLFLFGATETWADLKINATGNEVCSPKIYFKRPSDWTAAYVMISGGSVQFPDADANGWALIDLGSKKTNDDTFFFINGQNKNDCNDGLCVTKNEFKSHSNNARVDGFTCNDVGATTGEIWIQEHPDNSKKGQTYITSSKPSVKDFYIFLPNNAEWRSATPLINEDGVDRVLDYDINNCGWYYRRYVDEPIPTKVVIHRDDDELMTDAIDPTGSSKLSDFFDIFSQESNYHDALYFVADAKELLNLPVENNGWFLDKPSVTGTCQFNLPFIIYDTDADLHPSFSCWSQGGEGCQAMGTAAQGVDKTTALAAINSCMGVITGTVESTLDQAAKKPKLSTKGKQCFINDTYFNQLFSYTAGVNEESCFEMPFSRIKNGRWQFDSDTYTSRGLTFPVRGGLYPVEDTDDALILITDPNQTPVAKARTKRDAEGPVYYGPVLRQEDPNEGVPTINLFCNGPGWDKGFKCNGLFDDGESTEAHIKSNLNLDNNTCIFGWSCDDRAHAPDGWPFFVNESETAGDQTSRWFSKMSDPNGNRGRNHHFCLESHGTFRFKKNLKLSVRGDDDIWIFIDNKLAVDLGGMHLPAPGYVDLDKFLPSAKAGEYYDFDIFLCDRRAPMSDIYINTNIYLEPTPDIKSTRNVSASGEVSYNVCISEKGLCGLSSNPNICGDLLSGHSISYWLVKGTELSDSTNARSKKYTTADQYNCVIDLTDYTKPKINDAENICGLVPGTYTLFMLVDDKSIPIETFRPKGNIDVVYQDAYALNANSIIKWTATSNTLPDKYAPVYISSLLTPTTATDSIFIDTQNGAGKQYTLSYDSKMDAYVKDKSGKYVMIDANEPRTIGISGIDTVYVSVKLENLAKPVTPFEISVSGSKNAATLNVMQPMISFVSAPNSNGTQVDGDDSDYQRKCGTPYDLYVAVFIPDNNGKYSVCKECDYTIHSDSETSEGFTFDDAKFANGFATISVKAPEEYCNDSESQSIKKAKIAVAYTDNIRAEYSPMRFQTVQPSKPGSPKQDSLEHDSAKWVPPQITKAEIFDARGVVSNGREYLDGIGDSVAIYYDRPLHKDSLPTSICIAWDSSSTEKFDNGILCNAFVQVGANNAGCSGNSGYCTQMIGIGDLALSKNIKTSGSGKIVSFTNEGYSVYPLQDRMAPVPLQATLKSFRTKNKDIYDSLVIILSEPVRALSENASTDALEFAPGSQERQSISAKGNLDVIPKGGKGFITYLFPRKKDSPQAGDYVRLGETLEKALWGDTTGLTGKETRHLPSPWVLIVKADDQNTDIPNFRVRMTKSFELVIELDDHPYVSEDAYAVMDMQGRILRQGKLYSKETVVPGIRNGSYIVKVGLGIRRVDVH